MEEETRQPRSSEDYMAMIVSSLGVNTPMDAWQWVEDRKAIKPVVSVDSEGNLRYARGIKIKDWLVITQAITKMVEEATI